MVIRSTLTLSLALVACIHCGATAQTPQDATTAGQPLQSLVSHHLFVSGTANTHTFRIPALHTAPNGDLIAVCDARRNSGRDLIWERDIDIVFRRSTDNGESWSEMNAICDFGDGKPASDASLIVDKHTGRIFCLYNYMDQDNAPKEFQLYVQSSADNGRTWNAAKDITGQVSRPEWKMDFKFITSGRGVQRANGDLLHTLVNLQRGLHLFGSRDHGDTWFLMENTIKPADESKVIELQDGSLMINSRVNKSGLRWVHRSADDGQSWTSAADASLVDPGCNASILAYPVDDDSEILVFCNANSASGRKNLTLRVSRDGGQSWSQGKLVDAGPSAYSSLTVCRDGSIGLLYERAYKSIRFARFSLDQLLD